MELREMRAFIAVVEEGGLSAAARRLHISQPSLSQTVAGLERELEVQLLVRGNTGVRPTEAGLALLSGARAVLARYDQAVAEVRAHHQAGGVLRIGAPIELPPDLLSSALTELARAYPATRPRVRHLSTAEQLAELRAGQLDFGLTRERPAGPDLDAALVLTEPLGVLLAAERYEQLAGPGGIRLESLAGLSWVSFPREGSPAWHDQLTAVLRGHGISLGEQAPKPQTLIAEVKTASVSGGQSFAFAPANWSQPIPDQVRWAPLVGHPLVRRTWAVWPATSRRRDIAHLVAILPMAEGPDD
jgi:DNA-binding transcriptional LysR family regulator